jgi:hypothetical protein
LPRELLRIRLRTEVDDDLEGIPGEQRPCLVPMLSMQAAHEEVDTAVGIVLQEMRQKLQMAVRSDEHDQFHGRILDVAISRCSRTSAP